MPEIPRYARQQTIPGESGGVPVNPAAASMSYAAAEKGGKAIAGLGEEVMRYAIVEQRADRALKAMKLETDLKNDVDATAESYAMRSDYDKFDNDVQTNIASLKQKHVDSIEDPVLKRAAEATFGKQSYELQKVIRDKKRVLMTEEATNRYGVKYNNALKEYAYATDPDEKEFIKNNVALEGYELEKSHLIKLGSTEKLMQTFNGKAANNYAQELIAQNPEVAFAALTERDAKGQYAKFTDLDPEDRIARQKEARSAVVTNHYETERKERDLQEDTKSDLFNKLDNKGYSRQKLLAEVQAAEQKDPVTGMRKLSPETAHAMRRTILKGDDDEGGNSDEFIRLGNRIVDGQMKNTDEIIQSTGLNSNEKKVLANMFWTQGRRDDKAQTAEEKAISLTFKNNRKFIIDSANKTIDALFPVAGDKSNKAMNTSLKANILIASERYDADTINDFRQYTDDTIKYAQTEASKTFSSKKKISDAILGAVKPELNVKSNAPATQKTTTGGISEQDARAQLTAKGITGKAQDDWIAQYKAAGKVK
jgi:hypothetical protein